MIAIRTGTEISNRPGAELVFHGERHMIHARTADASEKAELWPKIVAAYKVRQLSAADRSRDPGGDLRPANLS
jgi:hypothetical protein